MAPLCGMQGYSLWPMVVLNKISGYRLDSSNLAVVTIGTLQVALP